MTPALTGLHGGPAKGSACPHPGTEAKIHARVRPLQPDPACVSSLDRCFERPQPIGIALRLRR